MKVRNVGEGSGASLAPEPSPHGEKKYDDLCDILAI